MKDGVRTIAVTGANGYIGSRLCRAAIAANWNVVALGRRQSSGRGVTFAPYDFARPVKVDTLKGSMRLSILRRIRGVQILMRLLKWQPAAISSRLARQRMFASSLSQAKPRAQTRPLATAG